MFKQFSTALPPPPPPETFRKKRGRKLLSIATLTIIVALLLFLLTADLDSDGLNGYAELFTYRTNPFTSDSDGDGLPDRWEIQYGFNPTSSSDAFKDPDYDGLTNLQEYQLGTLIRDGVVSYQKDLFVEIDYMSGYAPSAEVINYFVSYYQELGILVHVTIDDEVSWSQLTAIGISSNSLSSNERYLVEEHFHDNSTTHVYVFYAKAFSDLDALGCASDYGAFINKERVNSQEGLWVLWLTDRIRTERVILLHEVGHTLGVIIRNQQGKEDYCSNLGCIMAGADEWWDIIGGISQLVVLYSDTPRYCHDHATLINLRNKWSVDEKWIP